MSRPEQPAEAGRAGRRRRLAALGPSGAALAVWALLAFLALEHLLGVAPDQVDIYLGWGRSVLHGENPYGRLQGYPPAAMLAFAAGALGEPSVEAYRLRFALAMALVVLAGLGAAALAERRLGRSHAQLAWLVGVGAMASNLLLSRYDVVPATLSLVALVAVLRGRPGWAAAALGLGIALKPYLLVLVPLLAVWEWRRESVTASTSEPPGRLAPSTPGGRLAPWTPGPRGRRLALLAAWVVVPSALALAALAPTAGWHDATQAYGFQVTRQATQDSGPAAVVAILGRLGGPDDVVRFDDSCGCAVRTGAAIRPARTVAVVALAVGLLALLVALWRRPSPERLVVACCAALAGLLLAYPVFSPQYMVWLGAPVALLGATRAGRVAIGAAAVATGAAALSYQDFYPGVQTLSGTGGALLAVRVGAQLATLAALAVALRQVPTR